MGSKCHIILPKLHRIYTLDRNSKDILEEIMSDAGRTKKYQDIYTEKKRRKLRMVEVDFRP